MKAVAVSPGASAGGRCSRGGRSSRGWRGSQVGGIPPATFPDFGVKARLGAAAQTALSALKRGLKWLRRLLQTVGASGLGGGPCRGPCRGLGRGPRHGLRSTFNSVTCQQPLPSTAAPPEVPPRPLDSSSGWSTETSIKRQQRGLVVPRVKLLMKSSNYVLLGKKVLNAGLIFLVIATF